MELSALSMSSVEPHFIADVYRVNTKRLLDFK